jgi:hypothetical protein
MEIILYKMENVPKNYRCDKNPMSKDPLLDTEIQKNNQYIEFMKKNNFNRTTIKLIVYENKMNCYLYNDDFYNLYKYFKKYKELAYEAIDEILEKIQDDENMVIEYDFTTKNYCKNENAYINFCNNIKDNIELYEDILNKLFLIYKKKK